MISRQVCVRACMCAWVCVCVGACVSVCGSCTVHSGLFSSWGWCARQLQTLQLFLLLSYCLEQGTPRFTSIPIPSGLCSFSLHGSSRVLYNPAAGCPLRTSSFLEKVCWHASLMAACFLTLRSSAPWWPSDRPGSKPHKLNSIRFWCYDHLIASYD